MTNALDDLEPEQRAGVLAASRQFLDGMAKIEGLSSISVSATGHDPTEIDLNAYREGRNQVTTQTRYDPQLRLGEEPYEDGTLESLLLDVEEAKVALADCKGRLDDYTSALAMSDGEYRVGKFRLTAETKRTHRVSVPKPKKARR